MCPHYHGRAGSEKISFHSFPKTEPFRSLWRHACRRENADGSLWIPTGGSRICSEHFTEASFRKNNVDGKPLVRTMLLRTAVPTLFACFPEQRRRTELLRARHTERKRISMDDVTDAGPAHSSSSSESTLVECAAHTEIPDASIENSEQAGGVHERFVSTCERVTEVAKRNAWLPHQQ